MHQTNGPTRASSGRPGEAGALVISLDFELHWGMRERFGARAPAASELVRSRVLVPRLARLFVERGVRATWATVGFLFASSRRELEPFRPPVTPRYSRPELDPYREQIGDDETSDPLHLAGSLVRELSASPGQEIGSHTFSHYYCLEEGQDEPALRADLAAAQAIAERQGLALVSLVLPRNQWNPDYALAVRQSGFRCYRGPQPSWGHRARRDNRGAMTSRIARAARLTDTYVGVAPPPTFSWDELEADAGLCNVPASAFLRPYSARRRALEPVRLKRLVAGLRDAARRARIFHLWWHPHNFAAHPEESFDLLRRLLDEVDRLRASEGLTSLSMGDVATLVLDR